MSKNIRTQIGKVIGKTLNSYHARVKPVIDDIKFKEQYQGRIIDCMVGEVDDNYIETPETDAPIVKLEHSKEGIVKVPSIKGKTILIDSEGNETDTPAEGCRLVSVGEEEDNKLIILSNSANICNSKLIVGALGSNGDINNSTNNRVVTKDFIKIKPNNNLYFKPNFVRLCFYDKDMNFISTITFNNQSEIPNNAHYCKVSYEGADINKEIMISYFESNYTPYKQHKTEILLDEPLVKGNYIDCNKYVAQYKKITFDGSEHWGDFETKDDTVKVFLGSTHEKLANVKSVQNALNNYNILYGYNGSDYEHFYLDANFALFLNKSRGINTLQEFKDYLSKNNFELIVELKEPIITELPNGITLQGYDDTTMYIENSITPTVSYGYNALIPYKEELLNQKEEVETNTLDIEQNIIPYLMDMEFNLMLMEDN